MTEGNSVAQEVSLLPKEHWKRSLINAFIMLNAIAAVFGSSRPLREENLLERLLYPYVTWTRLLQKWSLFTPNPRGYALNYRMEITFKNGNKITWRRPYPPNWDFFARHLSYSFQKWDLASNYLEGKSPLWNDLSAYIQRLYWDDSNPPETLRFIRAMAPWPPPNETGYVQHDLSELRWHDRLIFTYHVTDKRLEE